MTDKNPWKQDDNDQQIDKYRKYDYYDYPESHETEIKYYGKKPSKFGRFMVFLFGILILVIGLGLAIPEYAFQDHNLIRAVIIAVVFGSVAIYWSRASLGRIIRHLGLWILIISGLSFFYLYQSDLSDRLMVAVDPSVENNQDGVIVLKREPDGHFWVRVWINGTPIRMMVDTGATNIVLSPQDARRVGIDFSSLNFNGYAETANGRVSFARYRPETLSLGGKIYSNLPVTINGTDMKNSLLGNSLLGQFSSIEIRKNYMTLRP